jgi:hypothetical protein
MTREPGRARRCCGGYRPQWAERSAQALSRAVPAPSSSGTRPTATPRFDQPRTRPPRPTIVPVPHPKQLYTAQSSTSTNLRSPASTRPRTTTLTRRAGSSEHPPRGPLTRHFTSRSSAHTLTGSPPGNLQDLPLAVRSDVHRHVARLHCQLDGPGGCAAWQRFAAPLPEPDLPTRDRLYDLTDAAGHGTAVAG